MDFQAKYDENSHSVLHALPSQPAVIGERFESIAQEASTMTAAADEHHLSNACTQRPSFVEQCPTVTVPDPNNATPTPSISLNPPVLFTSQNQASPDLTDAALLMALQASQQSLSTNTDPAARRRTRTQIQTTITRPAERAARDDLEALLPAAFRYASGGRRGNKNHAIFRGAWEYIRLLRAHVEELERALNEGLGNGEQELGGGGGNNNQHERNG